MAAPANAPPKKLSLVAEYMEEVERIEVDRRAKKRFRNVEGFPFWPHEFVRDMIFVAFFMAILFALSGFIPYYLEAPADPSGQPQVILPDWYLLWSYGLLKIAVDIKIGSFTLVTAKVLGVLLNGVVIAPLILVPFIHPGHSRRPVEEPFWAGLGAAGVMLAFTLSAYSVNGVFYPKMPPIISQPGMFGNWPGQGEGGAWLTILLPVLAFFLAYVPLKWRQGMLHYENKLSRNYYRIR